MKAIASTLALCILWPAGLALSPCQAAQLPVDYSSYQQIPVPTNSRVLRTLLKTIPYTKERAFHGRYGGSGNLGGYPIDRVDALCRKHDIIYATAKAVRSLRLADRVFVAELSELDPQDLTPAAREFRRRAIGFMGGNAARFFGKPPTTWFRGNEPGLTGPIDERQLTRFFHVSAGPRETRLLVAMIGKAPTTEPTPDSRRVGRPITQRRTAAFEAKSHSKLRGKR
jgi:hypothetical protein